MKTIVQIVMMVFLPIITLAQSGTLDTSFDGDGKKYFGFSTQNDYGEFVLMQPDNKIILGGKSSLTGGNLSFSLARLNPNGTFDNTFDTDGKVTTTYGTEGFEAANGALQTDGKIVVAGTSFISSSLGTAQVALVRYNSNGSLDNTFDTDGIVLTQVSPSNEDFGKVVKIQPDGKIVVGVQSKISFNWDFVLIRYNSDGSLDTTFDTDGIARLNLNLTNEVIYDIALLNDGKIIAVGYQGNTNDDIFIVRFNTNGSLDTAFGTSGYFIHDFASNHNYATAVALSSDNKIVIGGRYTNGTITSPFVARLNAGGTFDNTFDTDGILILTNEEYIEDVVLQSDNKILTFGIVNNMFGVSKINANGTFDANFGTNGKVETLVNTQYCFGKNGALQSDGKIVMVGGTYGSPFMKYGVVRYHNDAPLSKMDLLAANFKIYPNPTEGEFIIHTDSNELGATVSVYNFLGQKIKEFKIDSTISTQFLNKGMYILEMEKQGKISTGRLIVN